MQLTQRRLVRLKNIAVHIALHQRLHARRRAAAPDASDHPAHAAPLARSIAQYPPGDSVEPMRRGCKRRGHPPARVILRTAPSLRCNTDTDRREETTP